MAFVNEYISEEDAIKYKVFDYKNHYAPNQYNPHPQVHIKYDWVIDREENIYFFRAGDVYDENWAGINAPTGVEIFILSIKGNLFEIKLKKGEGSSVGFESDPYILFWDLVSIKNSPEIDLEKSVLTKSLEDVLKVYQLKGKAFELKNPKVTLRV